VRIEDELLLRAVVERSVRLGRIDELGKVEILNLQLMSGNRAVAYMGPRKMTPLKNEPFFVSAESER
jgi:hypothetical protein